MHYLIFEFIFYNLFLHLFIYIYKNNKKEKIIKNSFFKKR